MNATQFTGLLEVLKRIEERLDSIESAQDKMRQNIRNQYQVKLSDYEKARDLAQDNKEVSPALLQRKLKVGYAYAAMLMQLLEENGVIGPADGSRPRKILTHTQLTIKK